MQVRKCKNGHTWTITRKHKRVPQGLMSWTEGTLNCPICKECPICSGPVPIGCIVTTDERGI